MGDYADDGYFQDMCPNRSTEKLMNTLETDKMAKCYNCENEGEYECDICGSPICSDSVCSIGCENCGSLFCKDCIDDDEVAESYIDNEGICCTKNCSRCD